MALSGSINGPFTVNLASLGIPIGAGQVITFTTDYPNNDRRYLGVYYRSGIQVSPLSITLNNAAPNGSITITPFAPGPYIIPYTISSAFTPHCGEYTGFIDVLVEQDLTVRVGGSFNMQDTDIIDSDIVTGGIAARQPGRDLHISGIFTLLRCAFGDIKYDVNLYPAIDFIGHVTVTADADYIYVDYDITIVDGTWPYIFTGSHSTIGANSPPYFYNGCAKPTNCETPSTNIWVGRSEIHWDDPDPQPTVFKLLLYVYCIVY